MTFRQTPFFVALAVVSLALAHTSNAQAIVRPRPAPAASGSPSAAASPGESPSPPPGPMDALAWRNIGPTNALGRLAAVAGSDLDPALVYVGSAGGGVWQSTDGTTTWKPVFDKQDVGSIGAVAISPRDPKDVWVGTGEGNPRNDVSYGDGIYRTTDAAKTWKHLGLAKTYAIAKLSLDPRDARVAVAAALGSPFADSTDRGVYRTADGGATWQQTLFLGPQTGAADLTRSATDPNLMFAAMWQFHRSSWHLTSGGPLDGLFRSKDGGATWARVAGRGFPTGLTGRIGVAIAPSDPKRVYAIVESNAGLVWRSDDGGTSWRPISNNTLVDERPFYYTRIFVDPNDENHLLATSVRLAESKDGGATWQLGGKHLHGDHHDVWFAKDGRTVLEGNDGGIGVSRSNGATWEWRRNVPIEQAYRIATDDETPYDVCMGLQDNGSWCGPSGSGIGIGVLSRAWLSVGGGDGNWTIPDPARRHWVYTSSGGGNNAGSLVRYDVETHAALDVSPYQRDQNVVAPSELRYRFNWESPLAFSPFDGRIGYYGGDALFRTTDHGVHWQPISPDLTRNIRARQGLSGTPLRLDVTGAETYDTILDVAPSPAKLGEIWVSTDDGRVQLTRDEGAHWRDVTMPAADPDTRIPTICASQTDPATLYAVADRHFVGDDAPHVYVTHDFGATWRTIDAGLPAGQVARAILEDPRDPNVLFLGLENSVWWSDDRGGTWRSLQQNMPAASVRDLHFQRAYGDLLAATHGRSAWVLDDVTPLEQAADARRAGTMLFAPRIAYQQVDPDGAGDAGGAIVTYYLSKVAAHPPTLDILDSNGRRVRSLTASADPVPDNDGGDDTGDEPAAATNVAGFNRVPWDLTGRLVVPWRRAPSWNRTLPAGPTLLPGTYVVRLVVDGKTYRQPLVIAANPHLARTAVQRAERVSYDGGLVDTFSRIDVALNTLDNVQAQIPARLALLGTPPRDAALAASLTTALAEANREAAVLSSHPINGQDNDFLEDVLRERVQSLVQTETANSPSAEESREAGVLERDTAAELARHAAFIANTVAPLQKALAAASLAPLDLTATPSPTKATGNHDEHGSRREQDE